MNTISRTLITVVVVLLAACVQPQSGRAWTFDRQTGFPVDVSIILHSKQSVPQPLQPIAQYHNMTYAYDVSVNMQWELVNFYTITDWKTDRMGNRTETVLGQVSDPAGYAKPPEGFSGSPAEIPADVRKVLDKRDPDRLPLGRYPVKLTWYIRTDEDGQPLTPRESLIIRGNSQPLRVSELSLEKLLNSGHERFFISFTLEPAGWSDSERLDLFKRGQPTGVVSYKQHFDRALVLQSLGK